jgi:hypothetical protein
LGGSDKFKIKEIIEEAMMKMKIDIEEVQAKLKRMQTNSRNITLIITALMKIMMTNLL